LRRLRGAGVRVVGADVVARVRCRAFAGRRHGGRRAENENFLEILRDYIDVTVM